MWHTVHLSPWHEPPAEAFFPIHPCVRLAKRKVVGAVLPSDAKRRGTVTPVYGANTQGKTGNKR
jgi:hypothetical protein